MISNEYLQCSSRESWEYVILCHKTRKFRAEFVKKIKKDIRKCKSNEISTDEIDFLVEDILIYLKLDNTDEYMIN